MTQRRRILLISQVYPPDPASVGQQMADLAAGLAARGCHVEVLTSASGYEDPSIRYPRRETLDGVEIHRLPLSSLGKGSILSRLVGQSSFLAQCLCAALFSGRIDTLVITTSPPLIGLAALPIRALKRASCLFWVMDLNPDQAVAIEALAPGSVPVRALHWLNRRLLARSDSVVALDRFMAARLAARAELADRLSIAPPWAHAQHVEPVTHADNPFRDAHGLQGKFVVMYSGNHSPANPLKTVLDSAVRLRDRQDTVFVFVGGGLGKSAVERLVRDEGLTNVVSLPYQPIERLRYSLSAADLHVVTLGESMVGCIHPCKVYGAMAAARPVLYVGPEPSHISDLLSLSEIGWSAAHGDVDTVVGIIERLADGPSEVPEQAGARARELLHRRLSQEELRDAICQKVIGLSRPAR